VPEMRIEKADSLSRRLDWKVGIENDNENQKLVKKEWIRGMIKVVVKGPEMKLLEKIKRAKEKDEEVVRVIEEIKKAGMKNLRGDEWKIEKDLVLKEEKVYVPKDEELRMEIIWLYHDTPVAENRGRWKTTELVMRNYWWSEVTNNMGKYMDRCNACQRMKNRTEALVKKLIANEIPEKVWMYLTVDFITKLPLVAEKNAILVVCDRLSKIAQFVATTEETLVEGVVRLFRDNV